MTKAVLLLMSAPMVVGCATAPGRPSPSPSNQSLISLRVVGEEAAPGSERMEFGGEIISFAETIASDPDFEAVEPVVRPGRLLLRFVMKPESADRIRSVTANSVGRGLALVVDSEVRSVSVIRDSIGAMGVATIEVPTEEAEELAEAVRDSFPPGSPRAPRPVPIP